MAGHARIRLILLREATGFEMALGAERARGFRPEFHIYLPRCLPPEGP
jgi:hypothetical protein